MKISIVDDWLADAYELRDSLLKWGKKTGCPIDAAVFQTGKEFLDSCSHDMPTLYLWIFKWAAKTALKSSSR